MTRIIQIILMTLTVLSFVFPFRRWVGIFLILLIVNAELYRKEQKTNAHFFTVLIVLFLLLIMIGWIISGASGNFLFNEL